MRRLESLGLTVLSFDQAFENALRENSEAPDFRFGPMVERFERVFRASLTQDSSLAQELERLGLLTLVDAVVFCGDVGWRKPARQIFEHSAAALGRRSEECLFVGDDLEWDIAGSEAAGMQSVLLDRSRREPSFNGIRIEDLSALPEIVGSW